MSYSDISTLANVRPALPNDRPGMEAVVAESGLFPPDQLGEITGLLSDYFAGQLGEGHFWITATLGGETIGVAYYAPERLTYGTWNLYLIAVLPDRRGYGHGAALLHYVEQALAARGERVLLIETSGVSSFESTRGFYQRCGYNEEARIREFYAVGDDKIIFRKDLAL